MLYKSRPMICLHGNYRINLHVILLWPIPVLRSAQRLICWHADLPTCIPIPPIHVLQVYTIEVPTCQPYGQQTILQTCLINYRPLKGRHVDMLTCMHIPQAMSYKTRLLKCSYSPVYYHTPLHIKVYVLENVGWQKWFNAWLPVGWWLELAQR